MSPRSASKKADRFVSHLASTPSCNASRSNFVPRYLLARNETTGQVEHIRAEPALTACILRPSLLFLSSTSVITLLPLVLKARKGDRRGHAGGKYPVLGRIGASGFEPP